MKAPFFAIAILLPLTLTEAQDFSFIVYADVQGARGNHDRLVDSVNAMDNIAFAICAGDLAPLGNGSEAPADAWDDFLAPIQRLNVPFWPVRGNHDGGENQTSYNSYNNAFSFITSNPGYSSGAIRWYSFNVNNSHFIVLDNMSGPSIEQARWLENDLASQSARSSKNIFVFTHYPLGGPNNSPNYRWDNWIVPYFSPAYFDSLDNFVACFAGDAHYFFKGLPYKGVHIFITPTIQNTWSYPLPAEGEMAGEFKGYFKVDVADTGVTVTVYDMDKNILHTLPLRDGSAYDTLPILEIELIAEDTVIRKGDSTQVKVITTYGGGYKDTTSRRALYTYLTAVSPAPSFIKRINFQTDCTPFKDGWLADCAQAYNASSGYGWISASGLSERDDRDGDNYLLKTFVSTGSEKSYRIDVPDGEYVIKIGMGDNKYGSETDPVWVVYEGDTLVKHVGKSNSNNVDTVNVTGGNGLVMGIYGPINYLVIVPSEGIDINHVADDSDLDNAIARVSYDGSVKGIGPGTALIQAQRRTFLDTIAIQILEEASIMFPAAFENTADPELRVNPNPFNSVVRIKWYDGLGAAGGFEIYNIKGQCIKKVSLAGHLRSHHHSYYWDATGYPAGVYVIKLKTEAAVLTQKAFLYR